MACEGFTCGRLYSGSSKDAQEFSASFRRGDLKYGNKLEPSAIAFLVNSINFLVIAGIDYNPAVWPYYRQDT